VAAIFLRLSVRTRSPEWPFDALLFRPSAIFTAELEQTRLQ
jgi:hypothetical protein